MLPITSLDTTLCALAVASGGAATVTLTKAAGKRWVIHSIHFGYYTAPTSGRITINANGVAVFGMPITAAGAGPSLFKTTRLLPSITDGQTYTIVLADGSATKDLCVEAVEISERQL